ncbi:TRAFAC clade GTPase domain-containing protein [Dictyobacter arantiisoli]|nr:hypothetical protein [Dictyobacter arantiisoli]
MAFIDPWRKLSCPSCGTQFYPGYCDIVSALPNGTVLKKAPTSSIQRMLARVWITTVKGQKYVKQMAGRQCPNPACNSILPPNIEQADNYLIALIGDGSAGKSHYIASCIQLLKQRETLELIGCSKIVGWGNTDTTYKNKYYNYVFGKLQQIPLTPRATSELNEPLIYELIFPKEAGRKRAKIVNLFFYDSSGEDLADQSRMVQYSSYVLKASAFIFLADPLTMPNIVKSLPDNLKPQVVRESSSADMLNRITETFRLGMGLSSGEAIDVPVAVTLSKSDLLKYVVRSEISSTQFLYEGTSTNRLNTDDYATIDSEVRNFILRFGDKVLIQSSKLFNTVSFFAVSATGWAAKDGHYPVIESLRCLDPLLWILWKLQVIDAD